MVYLYRNDLSGRHVFHGEFSSFEEITSRLKHLLGIRSSDAIFTSIPIEDRNNDLANCTHLIEVMIDDEVDIYFLVKDKKVNYECPYRRAMIATMR